MRIIAGSRNRLKLLSPEDNTTRPITDRVKETLFNLLRNDVEGAYVADIFCGTGSLGLEALSRGANHAIMIDQDRSAFDLLSKNVEKCKFEDETTLLQVNSFKYKLPYFPDADPKTLSPQQMMRTLVFVDPPYKFCEAPTVDSVIGTLLADIALHMAPDGLVVVRHDKKNELLDQYGNLHVRNRKIYGKMALTFMMPNFDR